MANKIQIKRGAKANLPVLSVGEPAFTTDTKEFFIGDGSSNIEFAKQSDLDITNIKLSDLTYQTAGGTATAITLTMQALVNGYAKTFIASTNNNAAATTINGKPLYKPGTTVAPNLIAGKAYTVWYSSTGGCFFIKASAEGTAGVGQVLAGYTFSNDSDTGLSGTISSKSAATYTPTTTDQTIAANQYLSGAQTVKGDTNLVTGNIKSGASIFGVAGKSSVVDTSDANATSGQILLSQTAYVNGSKITGTMTNRANTKFQICGYEGITECIPHPSDPGNQGLVTGQNVYGANGYIDGNSQIQMSVAGLVPGNIKAGVKVGKNSGTGSSVMTGTFTSDATANAGQILNGQTAYVNGNKITGTMIDRTVTGDDYWNNTYPNLRFSKGGALQFGTYGISNPALRLAVSPPQGYYPGIGSAYVSMEASDVASAIGLTSDKLISGTTVCGVSGNFPNLGSSQGAVDTWQSGSGQLVFRVPSIGAFTNTVNGYKPEVSAYDANFIASNILSGKSIFGLTGSATIQSLGGYVCSYGTFGISSVFVNGKTQSLNLPFVPRILVIYGEDYSGNPVYGALTPITGIFKRYYTGEDVAVSTGTTVVNAGGGYYGGVSLTLSGTTLTCRGLYTNPMKAIQYFAIQ